MALSITAQGRLDMSNAQKTLDSFLKQKAKLKIDVNITGFDSFQNDLNKFQDAVNKIIAERKNLEESIGSGNLNTQQIEALKFIEQKEKELAAQRERMMKQFAELQEQITKVRLEALERIQAKEQENAEKSEEAIKQQAAAFEKMYGTFKEGAILPITGGTEEITNAIHSMDGFADANVKAIGSVQVGEITLDRYIATLKNAGGDFDTYKISVDNATGSVYLLDQGLKSTDASLIHTSEIANGVINSLAGALVAAGIGKGLNEIKDLLWDCVEASIEFESALANVRKTTNFPLADIQTLKEELFSLSAEIPLAVTELSRIAEIGGQLNIPQERIIDFTKIMADLGATTSMTSTEAADFVARFSNITQMSMDNWDRFAASLVALGNNFAGTESEISAMSIRLASSGKLANMTEADILGLSAGLVSVGIKAEMGGTAFSKAMNRISIAVNTGNDELQDFARIAGLSVQEFVEKFNTDAAGALIAFIQGLGDVERHGKNTIVLMDEIGLTEVRMSDALRRAAGSGDLFSQAIALSNTAFEENVALQNEAAIRYATTESQMQLLSNATFELQTAIGDALIPTINNSTGGLAGFTLGAAKFIEQNKWLVQAITVLVAIVGTAAGGITLYAVGIKALAAAKLALAAATKTADAANKGFMATLVATPLGPVIIALAAIAGAITAITIAAGESEAEIQKTIELAREASELSNSLTTLISKYNELSNAVDLDDNAKFSLLQTQDELLKNLGLENQSIDSLIEKYGGLTEAIRVNAIEKLKSAEIDITAGITASQAKLLKAAEGGFLISKNIINATGEEAVKAFEALEKASVISSGSYGSTGGAIVLSGNEKTIEGAIENYNRLKQALEVLQDAFTPIELANNSLYQNIYDRYSELSPAIEGYNSSIANLNSNLAQQQVLTSLQGKELPKIKDDFDAFTQSIIDSAVSSGRFIGSIGDIEASVKSILQTFPEFKVFFKTELPESTNATAKAASALYDEFAKIRTEFEQGSIKSEEYTDSLKKQLTAIEELIKANPDMASSYEYVAEILRNAIATAPDTLKNLRDATLDVVDSAYTLSSAFKEQSENGSLSLATALKLIDAGYAVALSIDSETGAVTINQQAYLALAKAKIDEQIASLKINRDALKTKLENEKTAVENLANAYYLLGEEAISAALKEAKARQTQTEADVKAKEIEIASLENLKGDLSKVSVGDYKPYSGGGGGSSGSSSSNKYNEGKRLLDQEYQYKIISAQQYYDELEKLRAKYYDDSSRESKIILAQHQEILSNAWKQEAEEQIALLRYL